MKIKGLNALLASLPNDSDNDADAAVFDEYLRLGIPNEFIEFCEDNHTTPKEVLHGFIADLLGLDNYIQSPRLDNLGRNGSDECDLAEEYFRRVGYQYRDGEIT